jgi:hypothetical protein
MFRYPVVVGGGTPFLPPVAEDVPLDLIETRTFGSRVIYAMTRTDTSNGALIYAGRSRRAAARSGNTLATLAVR